MKKELKWTFEEIEFPKEQLISYACAGSDPNPYFTRPLYDEDSDLEISYDESKK